MKNLVVLALVAVVAVEAMPQAVEGNSLTPSAAVPQTPGMILTAAQGTIPTQLVQIASPLFQGAPATAGPGPAAPQLFSLTPIMRIQNKALPLTPCLPSLLPRTQIHQLSEAEQNALAHREFLKIWKPRRSATRHSYCSYSAPAASAEPIAVV
ncbi:hypothetical protein C7M84_023370 [Penaeus vannamei]|uniref:Uncharacterized protein n=1 Tax=Penaeus vannamei TaxID=6689 RepID=A0A3R7QM46_PENVA|nr:hypothetical protein C7M84_023370 [Penaeus vannamei]